MSRESLLAVTVLVIFGLLAFTFPHWLIFGVCFYQKVFEGYRICILP